MSKSGVGYSWGTKGYRITKTASGKTRRTYSIPGTGLSYVSETGQNRYSQRNRSQNNAPGYRPTTTEPTYQQPFGEQRIESAEIKNFQSAEFGNITSAIERTLKMNKWGTILLWCVLLAAGNPAFILLPIIEGVLKVVARSKGAVNFDDLQIQVSPINFVESEPVPKDAQVIGQTWQFVNKNGTPDKRYKNNRCPFAFMVW